MSSPLVRKSASTTPEFVGAPDVTYPFLNYPTPDKYARVLRQRMKQASVPFAPIVATRTSMTNLLLQSEALGTTWTANAVTIGTDGVANPNDGTVNADRIIDSAANSAHSLSQAVTITAGVTYTFAVAVLASGRTRGRIRFGDASFASVVADLEFDLSAGTATGTATTGAPTISNVLLLVLPNSTWAYLLFSVRLDGSTTAAAVALALHNGTSYSYAGDAASGAYFYRPTLVAGSYTRLPLIDTTTTTRTISAPELHPEDPFCYIVREDERPAEGPGGELQWFRDYAVVPKEQTSYPGSEYFTKPAYDPADPYNPFDITSGLAVSKGTATRFTDWASLGNASYSAVNGLYTSTDSKIYNSIKVPASQTFGYATAGTFTLTRDGETTGALNYNDSPATILAALNALSLVVAAGISFGVGNYLLSPSGGHIQLSLTGGSEVERQKPVTLNGGSLTLTAGTSNNPVTAVVGSAVQLLMLPSHLAISAHGYNTALDLALVWTGPLTFIVPTGKWGSIDANNIWVPPFNPGTLSVLLVGTYSTTYTLSGAATYAGGIRLVRTKLIETFYLIGVTSGISSHDDIPTPAGLQNPNTFLTALLVPLTGYQAYKSEGPFPWLNTLLYALRNIKVKFEDLT